MTEWENASEFLLAALADVHTLSRFGALCFCQRLYSEKYLNSVHRFWREEARARAPSLLCKPVLHVSLVSHHTSLPFLPLSCTLPCPFYTARYLRFDKLEIAAPATLMVLTLLVKRWTRVAANDAPNINGRTCTRTTLCWLFFSSLWLSALVWFRLVSCRERTKLTKRFQRYRRL